MSPALRELLPQGSNIRAFQERFVVESVPRGQFGRPGLGVSTLSNGVGRAAGNHVIAKKHEGMALSEEDRLGTRRLETLNRTAVFAAYA